MFCALQSVVSLMSFSLSSLSIHIKQSAHTVYYQSRRPFSIFLLWLRCCDLSLFPLSFSYSPVVGIVDSLSTRTYYNAFNVCIMSIYVLEHRSWPQNDHVQWETWTGLTVSGRRSANEILITYASQPSTIPIGRHGKHTSQWQPLVRLP